jgi:succinyl-CoA synthetase beta subunit
VRSKLLTSETIPAERRELLAEFIALLHAIYVDLHFTYLEINPLVVVRPPPKPLVAAVMCHGQLTPLRFRVGRQQRSRA